MANFESFAGDFQFADFSNFSNPIIDTSITALSHSQPSGYPLAPSYTSPVSSAVSPVTPNFDHSTGKKRKLDSGAPANGVVSGQMNDAQHAKHPGMMTSNKHTIAIHERLKRECETLAELCVRMVITYLLVHGLSRLLGQGQALD